jgi:catechol 2,3-dioxygenase-like lactoylglutathione lyase family enzyme
MIAVKDIAFVRYQVTDLDRMETFLTDFGLQRAARTDSALYMRAADGAHHVHISELGPSDEAVGFGLHAQSVADLDRIAECFGKPVETSLEPGGGLRVRVTDPAGFVVDVIHGQARQPAQPVREPITSNPCRGRRRLGTPIRLRPAPSTVMRIGHVALLVPDFAAALSFYRDLLGFRASDTYWIGAEGNTVAAFMHCGLGDQWTDHHTLALVAAQDGKARFDHSSFEVIDLDDVMHGSAFLQARGWTHSWGVGRHIQGSQIFDYWRDPFGNKHEHYTDGDLVNDSTPVGTAAFSLDELRQWAPPLTPEFMT